MAARDNPYFIEPVNAMQALMSGYQGYDRSQAAAKEAELQAGRRDAAAALQSGGDLKGLYGQLLGLGDINAAKTVADFAHQDATAKYQQQNLTESGRHNRAVEGNAAATLNLQGLQPVKISDDPVRGAIYGIRDPKSPMGYRVIDPNQLQGGGGQPGGPRPVTALNAEGEDASIPPNARLVQTDPTGRDLGYLKEIELKYGPETAALVKNMADYNVSPTSLSTKGGHREAVLGMASKYDPTFNSQEYPTRQQARVRFSSGPQGDTIRSMNVAIDHLATLHEYADALKNGDVRLINSIGNKFKEQFGYDAPTNFDAVKSIVGAEVSKAIVGSKGALADREEIRNTLNRAGSPDQLVGPIAAYKKLMAGQVKGLKQQYEASGLKDFDKKLFPATIKELGLGDEQPGTAASGPVKINSAAERDALKPGQQYIAPDGSVRTRQ
jgi:hypothetical protein